MTDPLLARLDKYVISLLDEAERPDCGDAPKGDTQEPSEEGPGLARPAVSLETRIALLKSCTQYMQMRSGKKPPDDEPEEPAEIDGFVTRLRPKNRTGRR
ncbi:MAG TPA: hypothetical protein VN663_22950 [Ramlibacter sp.]|nr:hypothetical protein [Ramlibacter sp.]